MIGESARLAGGDAALAEGRRGGVGGATLASPPILPEVTSWPDLRAAAFEVAPAASLVVNEVSRIIDLNEAALALCRTSRSALIGELWWRLLSPNGGGSSLGIAHGTPGHKRRRYTLHTSDGDRQVLVQAFPITVASAGGCTLLVMQEEWHGEERRAPTTDSLLLDTAHELRSPLLSFTTAIAALAEGQAAPLSEDQRRLVGVLRRSAFHLQTLVENLLDAARLRANTFSIMAAATPLAEVVSEAVAIVEPLLEVRGQRVTTSLPPGDVHIYADAHRLRQVLVNLLHNASKYGLSDETISITAQDQNGSVLVEVSNRGPEIPEDEQSRVFERGFRGRGAAGSGSGLGLAICRAIIAAHGGDMGLRTWQGGGTTVWFRVGAA